MTAVDFSLLPADARLWIFAASRPLAADESAALLARVDAFVDGWLAHGHPVVGARDWRHDRFLLVGADERATGVSGCSIDSLFRVLKELEGQLGAGLLKQEAEARRRPDWVPLSQLPPHVREAFLAVVDTTSTLRQPGYLRRQRPSLARDLVRQVHQLEPGLKGQASEVAMAQLLEAERAPGRRLELYLNRVYLGRTESWPLFGVHHAAMEYFGKDVRRLTLGEAATLAGILLPPRVLDPEAAPGPVGARRNEVLRLMHGDRRITDAQLAAALAEPLGFQPGEDYAPMTRPVDWSPEAPVIRLPEALRPRLDSLPPAPQP